MSALGLHSAARARAEHARWLQWAEEMQAAFGRQQQYLQRLNEKADGLWRLNETWAWNDNVTLRFKRKQQG